MRRGVAEAMHEFAQAGLPIVFLAGTWFVAVSVPGEGQFVEEVDELEVSPEDV